MQAGDWTTRASTAAREHGRDGVSYYIILHGVTDRPKHKPVHRGDKFCTSLYSLQSLPMPRNATKEPFQRQVCRLVSARESCYART